MYRSRALLQTLLNAKESETQRLHDEITELKKNLQTNYAKYQILSRNLSPILEAIERLATALAASGVANGLLADTIKTFDNPHY